jgi:hypothetical protein
MLDPINPLDPINFDDTLSREIDRRRLRPLFYAAVILVFLALVAWKHVNHHTTGSAQEAKQAINLRYTGGLQTINCTTATNGNPIPGILQDLNPWASSSSHYDCTGIDTNGQPEYWCVTFPGGSIAPAITQQYADGNCT